MVAEVRVWMSNFMPLLLFIDFILIRINYDDVIKWRHFPHCWSHVSGFPSQTASNADLWYLFNVSPNKMLNKHSNELRRHDLHVTSLWCCHMGMSQHKSMAWIRNCNYIKLWDVVTHPCPHLKSPTCRLFVQQLFEANAKWISTHHVASSCIIWCMFGESSENLNIYSNLMASNTIAFKPGKQPALPYLLQSIT